ncbi:MAG: LapA family protein, partial [Chitinispirillales bacterium]|nr:LapA family protein [Chitinispirillales bacterium]
FVFAIAFAAAWIIIFTFTQAQFSASAPVKIFVYTTAPFPIYIFVTAAFGIGLLIGFAAAAYYFVAGQTRIRKMTKTIKTLKKELSDKDDSSGENSGKKKD